MVVCYSKHSWFLIERIDSIDVVLDDKLMSPPLRSHPDLRSARGSGIAVDDVRVRKGE